MTVVAPGTRVPWPAGPSVPFPGRQGWIALPPDRMLARSGIATFSACRPRAVAAQWAAWASAGLLGPRLLGQQVVRGCPVEADEWETLTEQWRQDLGPFDSVLPLMRRQVERTGFALLLHDRGRRRAFVKLRRGSLGVEPAVLDAAGRVVLSAVRVPRLLGVGLTGGWHWFAAEPLPDRIHRAGRPALAGVCEDVAAVVAAGLPAGPDVPAHWVGAHGDLTPWNLRRTTGGFVVFDWEDAGWAPPLSDAVGYVASAAAAHGRSSARLPATLRDREVGEAVAHVLRQVGARDVVPADAGFHARLVAALAGLADRSAGGA